MTTDIINAAFEFGGAIAVWSNVVKVLKDRGHAGISVWGTAFILGWGLWNTFYYPSLNQWFSFAAGCFICLANFAWLAALIYFGKIHSNEETQLPTLHSD